MKKTKKLLCLLLIVAAAMWLVPTMVFADGGAGDDSQVTGQSTQPIKYVHDGNTYSIDYDLQGVKLNKNGISIETVNGDQCIKIPYKVDVENGFISIDPKAIDVYYKYNETDLNETIFSDKSYFKSDYIAIPINWWNTYANKKIRITVHTYKLIHDSQSMEIDTDSKKTVLSSTGLNIRFKPKSGYNLPYPSELYKNFEVKYSSNDIENDFDTNSQSLTLESGDVKDVYGNYNLSISSDTLQTLQAKTFKITDKAYKLETALEGFKTTSPKVEVTENDPYPCTLKISDLKANDGYSLNNKTIKVMTGQNYANPLTEGDETNTTRGYVCDINNGKVTLKINFDKIENNNVKIVANAYKFDVSYELNDGFETPKAEIDVNNSGKTLLKIPLNLKNDYMPNEYRVKVLTGSDLSVVLGKNQDQGYMYVDNAGFIDIQIPVENIRDNKVEIIADALYVNYSLGDNVEMEKAQVGNGNHDTLKIILRPKVTSSRNGAEALKVNAVRVRTGENLDKVLKRLVPGESDPDENYRSKVDEDGKIILEIKIDKIEDEKLRIEYDLGILTHDTRMETIAYFNTDSEGVTCLSPDQITEAATSKGVDITLLYTKPTQKHFLDELKIKTVDPYATWVSNESEVAPSDDYKNVTITVTVTADDESTQTPYKINFIVDQKHVWQEPKWTWNDDNTAAVTFTCDNLAHATGDGKIKETDSPIVEMTKTEKTKATCISEGEFEYKGKAANQDGKYYESSKLVSTPIDKNNHDWKSASYTWEDVANGKTCTAVRICTRNDKHIETAAGKISVETKAPTCTEKGETTYTAKFTAAWAAQQTKAVEIPAAGHTIIFKEGKPATCTESGIKGYYTCSVCGQSFEDKEGNKKIDDLDEWKIIPANGHKDDNKDNICDVCGTTLGEKPVTPPSYPSYQSGGFAVPSVHTHSLTLVSGKPAACTEDGVKDYYKCGGCGKYFEDQNAAKEIKDLNEWKVIKALGHKDANNDYMCDICGTALGSTSENLTDLTDIFETEEPGTSTTQVNSPDADEQEKNNNSTDLSDTDKDKNLSTGNGGFEPLAVLSVISVMGIGGAVIYGRKRKGGK